MEGVPDFIKEDQAEREPMDLNRLAGLIEVMKERKAKVTALKEELEAAEGLYKHTIQEDIPELMRYFSYSKIELATKEVVKIKEDASVSIPEGREQLFFKFLADRGEQDIIKLQFSFPRMPNDRRQLLFDLLAANDFEYEFKEGVHWQTLQAYFRKLLGIGEDPEVKEEGIRTGRLLHPDAVRDFAVVFTFWTTSLTAPKGGSKL